jgi:predicted thioesterase
MKPGLVPGVSRTARITVDAKRSIDFMGDACRVYATPELVRDIEHTARDLLLEYAESGEDSVGTRVAIDHLAATPLGMWVDITVTVRSVEGRMIALDVTCSDPLDKVAAGEHRRAVINVEKIAARLREKSARAK